MHQLGAYEYSTNNIQDDVINNLEYLFFLASLFVNMKSTMHFNPFSAGTAFMLMQTGWIQASLGGWPEIHPVCYYKYSRLLITSS